MNRNLPRSLTKAQTRFVSRPDLTLAAAHFAKAAEYSRNWDSLVAESLAKYGDKGAQISGICRDHFPQRVKEELRQLSQAVSDQNRTGNACRPSRVHAETLNRLARLVCRRDGTGFYGYQIP